MKYSLALLCLGLSACTFFRLAHSSHLKTPSFAYESHAIQSVDETETRATVTLASYNPNSIGLRNVSVSYDLFTEGHRFLKGKGIQIDLKPLDTTHILVPMEIVYRDIYHALGPTAEQILRNRKSLPVRVDAVIVGNPTLYNEKEQGSLFHFTVKVSKEIDIPLPDWESEAAKTAKRALKKLF